MDSTGALELPDVPESLLVVGGGYIGAETAAGLSLHGLPLSLVFPEDHIMARIMPPEIADVYES